MILEVNPLSVYKDFCKSIIKTFIEVYKNDSWNKRTTIMKYFEVTKS